MSFLLLITNRGEDSENLWVEQWCGARIYYDNNSPEHLEWDAFFKYISINTQRLTVEKYWIKLFNYVAFEISCCFCWTYFAQSFKPLVSFEVLFMSLFLSPCITMIFLIKCLYSLSTSILWWFLSRIYFYGTNRNKIQNINHSLSSNRISSAREC